MSLIDIDALFVDATTEDAGVTFEHDLCGDGRLIRMTVRPISDEVSEMYALSKASAESSAETLEDEFEKKKATERAPLIAWAGTILKEVVVNSTKGEVALSREEMQRLMIQNPDLVTVINQVRRDKKLWRKGGTESRAGKLWATSADARKSKALST